VARVPDLTVTPIGIAGGLNDSVATPQPGDFQQLTNFVPFRGRLAVRAPVVQTANITDVTIDGLIGGAYHRDRMYVAAWDSADDTVRLYELSADGTGPTYVDDIWTSVGGTPPSAVVMASIDGGAADSPTQRLYIADWDQNFNTRSLRDGTTMVDEKEDFDDNGTKENFMFNYVFTYNYHVFGAGFLEGSSPIIRPELLHVSRPGIIPEDEPDVTNNVNREWWSVETIPIGTRGLRIYSHAYAGESVLLFKRNQTYVLFGYSYDTFTLKQLSDRVGAVGPGATCWTDDGVCFFWSERGLMMTDGTRLYDISDPTRNHVSLIGSSTGVLVEYSADDGQVYILSPEGAQLAFDKTKSRYWEPSFGATELGGGGGIPS
jgi:hypothetical protein